MQIVIGFLLGIVGDLINGGVARRVVGLAKLAFAVYLAAALGYFYTALTDGTLVFAASGFRVAATNLGYVVLFLSAAGVASAIVSGDHD